MQSKSKLYKDYDSSAGSYKATIIDDTYMMSRS
jgi:hypothetical protein